MESSLIKHNDWLLLNDITYLIYSVDDLEKMRELFLNSLQKIVAFDRGFFDLCMDGHAHFTFFNPVAVNIPDDYLRKYFEYFQHVDYANWIFTQKESIVYRDTDLVGGSFREKSEYFKDWFLPLGLHFGAGTSIIEKGIVLGSLTIYRDKDGGDFSDRELFILELLNRHLGNRLIHNYPEGIKTVVSNGFRAPDLKKLNLSKREMETVSLVINGYSNKEIGNFLYISESTVKKHLYNIFKKLNIKSRTQLQNVKF